MISIDNSVELMVKTFLGLPKRVTGLQIGREKFREIRRVLQGSWTPSKSTRRIGSPALIWESSRGFSR